MVDVERHQNDLEEPGIEGGVVAGSAQQPRRHRDLHQWWRQALQRVLPHDVLIAVWGEFRFARLAFDIVSDRPDWRTASAPVAEVGKAACCLHRAWRKQGSTVLMLDSAVAPWPDALACLSGFRGVLALGLRDERAGIESLYVFLRQGRDFDGDASVQAALWLPTIDARFRGVRLLPAQDWRRADKVVPDANPRDTSLTMRESEILSLVAAGLGNTEIGRALNLSPLTVRNHLHHLFRKLDVHNRAQAVAFYARLSAGDGV